MEDHGMTYDDASWHSDGDFPSDLPDSAGCTHIAVFLTWATLGGVASADLASRCGADLARLESRAIDPVGWFGRACDGTLTAEDLSAEGNAFARGYYGSLDGLNTREGGYLDDYARCFPGLPSLYHVPADWCSYDRIAPVLTRGLRRWRLKRWLSRVVGR